MRHTRKLVAGLLMSLTLLCLSPVTVNATEQQSTEESTTVKDSSGGALVSETGDAIQDIMSGERFSGAISSIRWFTTRVDSVTIMLISGAAFFIICASFLKNVCAGVYCSNSKFFDKVDEAHKKAEALSIASIKGYFGGGQFQNTSYGTLRDSLLAIIPNFKAWTPFEDCDIEPKQYFSKSLPEMLFCVCIGVFIYNGYYRDTAMKVGEFGSEVFERVMMAASPTELLDRLTATTATPDFATEHLTSAEGQIAYKISKQVYSAVITRHHDITTMSQKEQLVREIESSVINWVNTTLLAPDALYTDGNGNGHLRKWSVSSTNSGYTLGDATLDTQEMKFMCKWTDNITSTMSNIEGGYIYATYVGLGEPDMTTTYEGGQELAVEYTESALAPKEIQWATTTAVVQIALNEERKGTLPSSSVEGYTIVKTSASANGTLLGSLRIYRDGTVKYEGSAGLPTTTVSQSDPNIGIYAVDTNGTRYYLEFQLR